MRSVSSIPNKIFNLDDLMHQVRRWRLHNKKIVFTNGVFDILHEGHIASLSEAASYGHVLIVGVNTDASVKRLKGESRPVNSENSRALILASLVMTDAIILFEEDTPLNLISAVLPDVLVKGGDYTIGQVVGANEVMANGGEVKIVPILEGFSTTSIIQKMRDTK
ncbi:MAG: D-glycero-beta-D-manno-heptose 1-phosphate adenylyltransferase [Ferruginibacter sp.]|nr:D-glycero-beta-D-manno-heptose 1-phosphate adenylyltransferase [Chitinophagaceae bacterium]MBP6286504.1 D-glycero-beta-D-manno-heptose 1-phosphate adenylyltransferase [Ferruginibacter sp.]MBU9937017.1 D-glycero-beta-D-manno-heptose 1-phosphate adenylyltransferase [Ferruginibacter sp.]HQY10958.1 D-glycero-beta-D-manno-heptose 1-phosphate adenylyltransferase [Ferruginibacter sp.]